MIVGIDVYKRSHAAALIDERGAALTIPNSRDGVARLRGWLAEHGAQQALVGAFLDTHRRQSVARRTDAIQRLRAVWAQVDPEAEAAVGNVATAQALRRLKEIDFGGDLANEAAARCIRDLASEIEQMNERIRELEAELASLLAEPGDPFADLRGARLATAVTLIAQSGDVRRFRSNAAYARYGGSAPIPCGSGSTAGRHRLHRRGNRQVKPACTASPSRKPAWTHGPVPSSTARWPKARRSARPAEPSSATSPTSSTAASTRGSNGRYPRRLDIGGANGRSPAAT